MTPFAALLRKDLRVELRTLRSLPAMALFAVTAFVIFRFGLDRTSLDGELAAGVLVPTLLFAALLAINRLFVAEREEGGFDLVRLAPVDRTVLFAAKASPLVIYLEVLELVAVPIFALLIRSYRVRGHLEARLDPLGLVVPPPHPELDPRSYGFSDADLDKPIFIDNVLGRETATLREIMQILRDTYCGSIGVEFMHIQDPDQKSWIQRRVEGAPWRTA